MTPALGTLIGLPIMLLSAIVSAVIGVLFWRHRQHAADADISVFTVSAICAWGIAGAFVISTALGMWPYKTEYHVWATTSGTVKTINSRLVSTGERSMEQRYVVTYTDGRQRACDDTRCTTVRPGDVLTLMCKRDYQWGATPGWDCNWLNNRKPS